MFTFKALINSWNKFFFEEKPTEGLAVFRIIWMGLIFCYYLLDLNNVNDFYGPHALISLSTTKDQFQFPHANIFHLFQASYEVTYAIVAAYGVALVFSIFGLFTRSSLIVALICMVSLHQRNIWLLSSSEVLMRSITLLLIFSPCGHSLSLDSLLARYFPSMRKARTWPVWTLRLIQIQISVVYIWTVWHKLKGETWFDGSAVYYATRLEAMTNFTVPFIMDSPLMLRLATWGTLVIELSLGILVWFKEFRRPVIIAGIFFHLSIEYLMSIPFFELYMIALLLNFYTPEEYLSVVTKARRAIIKGVHESALDGGVKEKILAVLGGQHEATP